MKAMPCADLSIIYNCVCRDMYVLVRIRFDLPTAQKLCCAPRAELNNNPSTYAEKQI